jgi:hypothetical protein
MVFVGRGWPRPSTVRAASGRAATHAGVVDHGQPLLELSLRRGVLPSTCSNTRQPVSSACTCTAWSLRVPIASSSGTSRSATAFSAPLMVPSATSRPSVASARTIRCTRRPSTYFCKAAGQELRGEPALGPPGRALAARPPSAAALLPPARMRPCSGLSRSFSVTTVSGELRRRLMRCFVYNVIWR